MNTLINDLGQIRYAVGMDGSIARLIETYPGFLGWVELMYQESLSIHNYPMTFVRNVLDEFEHRNIPTEYRQNLWEQTKFFTEMKINPFYKSV